MTYDLDPKTRTTPAAQIRPGDVVLERAGYPAVVTRATFRPNAVMLYCRYVWQAPSEQAWPFGPFSPSTGLEKAVRPPRVPRSSTRKAHS